MEMLAGAGASTLGGSWLVDRVLALEAEGELPVVVGPGIESWLPTACAMCPGGCGLEVRRIDGLPVGVRGLGQHPVNRGRLCALPHGAIQMLFSPDRVRRPLKRTGRRGQGMWSEVSWDDAEAIISERLGTLIAAGSRERVAFLDGHRPGFGRMMAAGFMAGVGSPHHVLPAEPHADEIARRMFGWERAPGADLEHSRVVLLFANDHFGTDGSPVWQSQVFALARDRTIDRPVYVGVGSRLLGSMAKCDYWLAVHPGSEGVVALAMARVILQNQWEDRKFLGRTTDWPEAASDAHGLFRLVRSLTPAIASEVAGVPAEQIEEAARRFVEHQPGVALVGPGTAAAPTSPVTVAAVYLLNVLVGAVGRAGGLVERPIVALSEPWNAAAGHSERMRARPIRTQTELAHALLANEPTPCDLLFVRAANPVFETPLGQTFRRGLASNDRTLVVFASELDETSALADLVLPEPTFLERWDIVIDTPTVPRALASLQRPAIEPLFGCRQSEEVLARLVARLGERARVVFHSTRPDELVRLCARGLLTDPAGAVAGPEHGGPPPDGAGLETPWTAFERGIVWAARDVRTDPGGASLRIHTMPGALLGMSEEPSEESLRAWAVPVNVGAVDRYPYELLVFRTIELRDGATTNVPMMMELAGHWASAMWTTWAEVHPRTAAQAGIADGDAVRVVSDRGHIAVTARVSETTPPGLVAIPAGFGHELGTTAGHVGANVNLIVAVPTHPLIGYTTRVNLVKA